MLRHLVPKAIRTPFARYLLVAGDTGRPPAVTPDAPLRILAALASPDLSATDDPITAPLLRRHLEQRGNVNSRDAEGL